MEKVFSFNDFKLDLILEALSKDELALILSNDLYSIISNIDHPIAKDIITKVNSTEPESKITYLDIDNSEPDKKDIISFLNSNKVIDDTIKELGFKQGNIEELEPNELSNIITRALQNHDLKYKQKNRTKTKIGRVIGKIFPGKYKQSGDPGEDIESFVNLYKASRDTGDFEIVDGEDIIHWYNIDQYSGDGGPLNNSCMRYENCGEYLKFYSENTDKISLVILKNKDDNDKIRGRAVLWKLDSPSGRTFMDRIYTVNDSDIILFQDYAKEQGWLYKANQDMDASGPWIDTINGNTEFFNLVVTDLYDTGDGYYPYMDTMKYFDGDTISNNIEIVDEGDIKVLVSTNGSYEEPEGRQWSDYYNEYINTEDGDYNYCECGDDYRYYEDCFWSEYYSCYVANDYADNDGEWLDYSHDDELWRDNGDYIETYEGHTSTEEYAQVNFHWSDWKGEWLEDGVYSEYHGDNLPVNEAIEVYTDLEGSSIDWRIDNESDGNWWTWDYDGKNYDNDITEEDLIEYHNLDDDDDNDDN